MTWIGSLPFNGHLCLPSQDFCASSEMKHDLFEYTTSSLYKRPMKFIVRFSPLLYPTVGGFGKDSGGQKLIYAKPPDLMVIVLWYPMEVVLKPARTNVFCCAVMAVSIITVWMVPKPMLIVWQPILVTKKTVVVPITQERHCDDVIARNAIQGALVLQKLSSDWTSTAFI